MSNELPFRPVIGTNKQILNQTPMAGHVWFATDTKKIYYSDNEGFLSMGGNTGVYYGKRILTDDEKYGEEVLFDFNISDIDGNETPSENDLILNVPDGGFYRVLGVEGSIISTQRLAMSGGGGGINTNEGTLAIEFESNEYDIVIAGEEYYIVYNIVAKDSAGDVISEAGTAQWKIGDRIIKEQVHAGRNSFRVDEYLDSNLEENKISMVLTMNTGGSRDSVVSKSWKIKAVALNLTWDWVYSESNYISDDTFALQFTPSGGVDCTVHIVFDDNMDKDHYYTKEIKAKETGAPIYSPTIYSNKLGYGAHKCSMYLTATINEHLYPTEPIVNEVTIIAGGTGTIITVPYYQKIVDQYDTVVIPFLVYNPELNKVNVVFEVNDAAIPNDEDYEGHDRSLHSWPYTISSYGSLKLTIKTADNSVRKDILLAVNKSELEITEVEGYAFSLRANTFSTNSELRNWKSNNVTLSFSNNFDWVNGGLKEIKDDNGNIEKVICVRQGTRMTINYPLFEKFNSNIAGGKEFKFCFKAVNCYDYEAPVLECYDPDLNIGIKYNAQQALFSSPNTKVSTQYYENSYIELETEIWPSVDDKIAGEKIIQGDRFIMMWIDGVPVRVEAYGKNEPFTHSKTKRNIIIGSDLCDVYVYSSRAYERKLTEEEHLQNFIMDAPSAKEMVDRYNRNDILDTAGDISYEKLVKNNPNCHVYMYEIPHMTDNKDDKDTDPELKKCKYYELFGSNNTLSKPYYQANNTQIYVQGTSSAAYGVAAFNLRSKFREGLTDKDGNQVEKWKVSDNAIPIDLACTKVNVASCENVNNVVNQEWYNRFQPYHDAHRRKIANARDTMEFNSGVVFVKDNNSETKYVDDKGNPDRAKYLAANVFADTPGYVSKPYFKQYAIGNMGNDKKNIEVFHDIMNPKACCVEVLDNQNVEHFMTVYNPQAFTEYTDENGQKKGPFYEFRYSVEDCEATDKQGMTPSIQEQQFLSFVQWMASCDPNPYDPEKHPNGYTGQDLPAKVTYEPKTFQGFDPPGFEGKENPSGISLKGFTISSFAGEYDKDTKEYRIAKMLNECENYLVMDSVVFHYLFIQRHTMVDNVAKNTFWSTEDGIHWDLTKDYDNDTADGNDNSGYLSYSYGYEFGDIDTTGGKVFNASDSVWINFIHELKEVQKDLHQKLQGIGAWNADPYLVECRKHQNAIPERCWIYDYFRKYIRPRRLGLDEDTYLKRLEGGQKTHQRTQFEKYQEFYMNSKYIAGPVFNDSSAINLRLNSKDDRWDQGYVLPISFYIDCYASAKIGGQNYVSQRLKRRQEDNLPVGRMLSSAADSTCYIYGANMMQTIKDLSNVYPNEADFNNANKLRELELGSPESGYHNEQLTKVNITSASMLQKVQIQNAGTRADGGLSSLNLENSKQLSDLRIDGSTFTGLTLPDGSIVENLRLNDLGTLSISNVKKLTKENLYVDPNIYNTLTSLKIIDSPAFNEFSYTVAKSPSLNFYYFEKINWRITSEDDLSRDDNDYIISIKVLDSLIDKIPIGNINSTLALSGTLTIVSPGKVNEYTIYEKYIKHYPNLIIKYENTDDNFIKANELIFLKDKDSDQQHYRVLSNTQSTDKIATLVSAAGPTGIAMITPSRDDTISHEFTFTGYWVDKNSPANNPTRYYLPSDFEDGHIHLNGAQSFEEIHATTSMTFYPEYQSQLKKYPVRFYDWDGNLISQNGKDEWLVEYGKNYDGPIKNYHYRDSSKEKKSERWDFKGWSKNRYGDFEIKNPEYIIPSELVITNTTLLYGHYILEDCFKMASKEEYFYITNSGSIRLNDTYKDLIKGKITIPATINGNKVLGIGGFKQNKNITHVFFTNDTTLNTIEHEAFSECTNLIYFNFPNSLIRIGGSAFVRVPLQPANGEYSFGDNIEEIGQLAFNQAFSIPNTETEITFKLPHTINTIGSMAFSNFNDSGKKINIVIGSPDKYSFLNLSKETGTNQSYNVVASFRSNNAANFKSIIFYSNNYKTWEEKISDASQYQVYYRLCNATNAEWLLYNSDGSTDNTIDQGGIV